MSNTLLILGLGNPGDEYKNTRHNAGRTAVLRWLKTADAPAPSENKKFFSLLSESKLGKTKVVAALPETFMNNSGKAALILSKFYKTKPQQIVVVHDDMDIPLGTIKISVNKSAGGHKGVASVMRALKTEEIARIRIGTGKSAKWRDRNLNKLVVGKFSPGEEPKIKKGVKLAAEALGLCAEEGAVAAMNEFNQR